MPPLFYESIQATLLTQGLACNVHVRMGPERNILLLSWYLASVKQALTIC